MIIGIHGNQGNGKSATMARLALHYNSLCTECNGVINYDNVIPLPEQETEPCTCAKPSPTKIHSNFWLNGIPNVHYVTTIEDIDKVHAGVCFYDELWYWLESRGSGFNDINQKVSSILMNRRKRGYGLVFESKLMHMIDRRIRELTDYVLEPHTYIEQDGELNRVEQHLLYPVDLKPYLGQTWVVVDMLEGVSLNMLEESLFQYKLIDVVDLYNTNEEIASLQGEKSPGIEKGIRIENEFIRALKNAGISGEIVQSKQSRGWDVILKANGSSQAWDVVSVRNKQEKDRIYPYIDIRNKKIKEMLHTAEKSHYKPNWAFNLNGKWFTMPMEAEHVHRATLNLKAAIELKSQNQPIEAKT